MGGNRSGKGKKGKGKGNVREEVSADDLDGALDAYFGKVNEKAEADKGKKEERAKRFGNADTGEEDDKKKARADRFKGTGGSEEKKDEEKKEKAADDKDSEKKAEDKKED